MSYPSKAELQLEIAHLRAENARLHAQLAADEQAKRAHLLTDIILKIRQSLQLEEILKATVTEVQKFLHADRVLLFRLWPDGAGTVVQETVTPGWPKALDRNLYDPCFHQDYKSKYLAGHLSFITDIEAEDINPCHREFLQQFGVRANLVVPIFSRDELWGLLIAHQCAHPRTWQPFEIELLQQIANPIGIALAQADLLEQENRQRQELARSNAELENFAYLASHDLQEPLRMVTSYLQLIERRYKDRLDQDAHEFIGYAVDGAARMQDLINDLLSYSRVNTRTHPFHSVDCNQVLQQVLQSLQLVIDESGAKIEYSDLPLVQGDSIQIIQVFQNLLSNGLKFHGAAPPQIAIGAELQQGIWKFWVRDHGIGLDMQYAERIFVIFQRLHSRTEYEGTGVGLAICKKIIERHGGQIWVESTLGQGTTFYFTLPETTPTGPI